MKVVLFCGGQGLRLRDGSATPIPKPLIAVGDQPILLHLMRYYAHFGHTDFILCLGYGARAFKQYFLDYDEAMQNDFVLSDGGRRLELLKRDIEDWRITFVDTGLHASVGERLLAVREHLAGEEYFLANYGDQLSDSRLDLRIRALQESGRVASLLSVRPHHSTHVIRSGPSGLVEGITPMGDGSMWINGGYFIFRRDIFDYMRAGEDLVEEPFARLVSAGELTTEHFQGFWAPMDTLKDKNLLDALASSPAPPWAVWQSDAGRHLRSLAQVASVGTAGHHARPQAV